MELLETMDKELVQVYLNKYLKQANTEEDEMWIFNMQVLAKKLAVQK